MRRQARMYRLDTEKKHGASRQSVMKTPISRILDVSCGRSSFLWLVKLEKLKYLDFDGLHCCMIWHRPFYAT
jgi:hypothetical protein